MPSMSQRPPVKGAESPSAGTCWLDPAAASCRGLWTFDGANGSTTFTDSSPVGQNLTAYGAAICSTDQVKWGTAALKGAGANSGAYAGRTTGLSQYFPGTADFAIHSFCYLQGTNGQVIFDCGYHTNAAAGGYQLYVTPLGSLQFWKCGVGSILLETGAGFVPRNTWCSVAAWRTGGNLYLGVNGTAWIAVANSTNFNGTDVTTLSIGAQIQQRNGTYDLNGYLDQVTLWIGTIPFGVYPDWLELEEIELAQNCAGAPGGLSSGKKAAGLTGLRATATRGVLGRSLSVNSAPLAGLRASVRGGIAKLVGDASVKLLGQRIASRLGTLTPNPYDYWQFTRDDFGAPGTRPTITVPASKNGVRLTFSMDGTLPYELLLNRAVTNTFALQPWLSSSRLPANLRFVLNGYYEVYYFSGGNLVLGENLGPDFGSPGGRSYLIDKISGAGTILLRFGLCHGQYPDEFAALYLGTPRKTYVYEVYVVFESS